MLHAYVLEGPDGVGKSTLAEALCASLSKRRPVTRVNTGPPKGNAFQEYIDRIEWMVEKTAEDPTRAFVIDRFHVGELVYGNMFRKTDFTIDQARYIDMVLTGLDVHMVHCTMPRDEGIARLVARDGGVPDEKSGAAKPHWEAIRAGFNAMCGEPYPWEGLDDSAWYDEFCRNNNPRILTAPWQVIEMTDTPKNLAHTVLQSRRFNRFGSKGAIGSLSADYVVAVEDRACIPECVAALGKRCEDVLFFDLSSGQKDSFVCEAFVWYGCNTRETPRVTAERGEYAVSTPAELADVVNGV